MTVSYKSCIADTALAFRAGSSSWICRCRHTGTHERAHTHTARHKGNYRVNLRTGQQACSSALLSHMHAHPPHKPIQARKHLTL